VEYIVQVVQETLQQAGRISLVFHLTGAKSN
jgi:hypothetical protein